jgi:hypothetical protein
MEKASGSIGDRNDSDLALFVPRRSKRLGRAGRGRLPPFLESLLELDADLLRSNTASQSTK